MTDVVSISRSVRRENLGIATDADITGPLARFATPTMLSRQVEILDDEVSVAFVGALGMFYNTLWRGLLYADRNGTPGDLLHTTDWMIHGDPRVPQEARFPIMIRLKRGLYHIAVQAEGVFALRMGTSTAVSNQRHAHGTAWTKGTPGTEDYALYLGCGVRTIGNSDLFSHLDEVTLIEPGRWHLTRFSMPKRAEIVSLHLFSDNTDFQSGGVEALIVKDQDGPAGIWAKFKTPERMQGWNRYDIETPTVCELQSYWIAVRTLTHWGVRGPRRADAHWTGLLDANGRFSDGRTSDLTLPVYVTALTAKAAPHPVVKPDVVPAVVPTKAPTAAPTGRTLRLGQNGRLLIAK